MARVVAIEINIKGQKDVLKLTAAIKQTNKALKQTQKEINEATTVTEKLGKQKAYDKQVEQLVRLKSELKGARQEQRNAIRDFEASKAGADSYRALNAELVRARQQFKLLSEAEEKGSKGKALLKNITRLDKALSKADAKIGVFSRNVGNYTQGVSKLGKTIARVFIGRSIVDGLRRVAGFLGDVVERNKETNESLGQLDKGFTKIKGTAEKLAISFLSAFAPAIIAVIDGVTFLAETIFGLSSVSNEATDSFFAQLESVKKLDQEITPLANRYDELEAKTNRTKKEQEELTDITKQLAKAIPEAATEWDEYGNVISVSTDKVAKFIQGQKELLAVQNQEAIAEQTNNLEEYNAELLKLTKLQFTGDAEELFGTEATQKIEKRRLELQGLIRGTDSFIKQLQGIDPFADFTKSADANSDALDKTTKKTKDVQTQFELLQKRVSEATAAVQEQGAKGLKPTTAQIDELKESTTELNVVNEQLKAILDSLKPAKEEDTKATKSETEATKDLSEEIRKLNDAQIEAANQQGIGSARLDALKEAQSALSNLTGTEENAAQLVAGIKQRLANQLEDIDASILQQQDQSIQAQIDNIQFQKDQELAIFEGSIQEKLLLEQQFNTRLAELGLQQVTVQEAILKKEVSNFKLAEEEKTAKAKKEGAERVAIAKQITEGFKTLLAAFDQLESAQNEAQIEKLTATQQLRNENLEKLKEDLEGTTGLERKFIEQQVEREKSAALSIEKQKEVIQKREAQRKKEAAIRDIVINTAIGVVKGFAELTPIGGAINAAFLAALAIVQIATISAQKFAKGGKVQPASGGNGLITNRGNIPTQPNGDNILATVKTNEVILNEDQQKRAGGGAFFNALGVPGFANGGALGAPVLSSNNSSLDNTLAAMQARTQALEGLILTQKVILNTNDTEQDDLDKQVILDTVTT